MNITALLQQSRPLLMGILNVTPDSFSDGGQFTETDLAVNQALRMVKQGADIIDVGGESTRPGSEPVSAQAQIARIEPVIAKLSGLLPKPTLISIDTSLAVVAQIALNAGAHLINDVAAGTLDPEILKVAARQQAPIALMHMQGTPKTMQENPSYQNVVDEVLEFLLARAEQAQKLGVAKSHILLDPGIGFGKTRDDNLKLMANLHRFVATGYPILLGTSRKRFMGAICKNAEPQQLIPATVATTALGVMAGVRIFRVHDIAENRQGADVAYAIKRAVGA